MNNFKSRNSLYEWLLIVIAVTVLFRKPSTYLLVAFVACNLIFFKKWLVFRREAVVPCLIIAGMFLLEIVFFWNNDSASEGLKSLEKTTGMLFLPCCILFARQDIDVRKILKYYARITSVLLALLLIRFVWQYPYLMERYLNGTQVWEMGYQFAASFSMHAPALNLYVSFIAAYHLYDLLSAKKREIAIPAMMLLLSVLLLLVINTRIALLTFFLNGILIVGFKAYHSGTRHKIRYVGTFLAGFALVVAGFAACFPYMVQKYTAATFSHLDKVGRLDEIQHPESDAYGSIAARLTVWESSLDLALERPLTGYGSADAKPELMAYYVRTDQKFLSEYQYVTHNQFLTSFLQFGLMGILVLVTFLGFMLWLAVRTKNLLAGCFFVNFAISNLTDDYLIKYDGIVYSALWVSLFAYVYVTMPKRNPTP